MSERRFVLEFKQVKILLFSTIMLLGSASIGSVLVVGEANLRQRQLLLEGGTLWTVATFLNLPQNDLLTKDVTLPLAVKERISIHNEVSLRYDATEDDVVYLLPAEGRNVELERVLDEYGYLKTPENFALIDEMGTPEDILVYFSDLWGTKPRSEKNDLRHQWKDYWSGYFYDYTYDMYDLLGNLIPETGYNLDLHNPLIPMIRHELTIVVDPANGGVTSPPAGSYWYEEGSSVTVNETPNPEFVFHHWNLDGKNVGREPSYAVTMNSPHTLTAVFVPTPISIYTDEYSYSIGNTIHVGLNITNPSDRAITVCIAVWLERPVEPVVLILHAHAVTLSAGFRYSNSDFKTYTLPNITPGIYIWHAAILKTTTHEVICEDTAEWQFS